MSPLLVERLVSALAAELKVADIGHCMRVDHLRENDAIAVCSALRNAVASEVVGVYVLDASHAHNALGIRPEQAIELRNRKERKLCLFVPAGTVDAAASSLGNSFAVFALEATYRRTVTQLTTQLPDDVRPTVRAALDMLRGRAEVPWERVADYVGTVLGEPTLERVGIELWRIDLIPDAGGVSLVERLRDNRRCVVALARSARPHASAEERVKDIGLRRGPFRDELLGFLEGRRLRDPKPWLRELGAPPYLGRLTFEKWIFESADTADLETIDVEPLLDGDGVVQSWSNLRQPHGPGTQPEGRVGPKGKFSVKWTSQPKGPTAVRRWRVELVPSRAELGDIEGVSLELPSAAVSAKMRRATLSLESDLSGSDLRAVQARVVGVDEHGAELRGPDGQVVEGLSTEFWLSDESSDAPPPDVRELKSVPTLAMARLRAAMEATTPELVLSPGQWAEGPPPTFSVTINGRREIRLALTDTLRTLERMIIDEPGNGGRYSARVDVAERLEIEQHVNPLGVSALSATESGATLMARRNDCFRTLTKMGSRGLVETAEWTPELVKRVRAYASAYRETLMAVQEDSQALAEASRSSFVGYPAAGDRTRRCSRNRNPDKPNPPATNIVARRVRRLAAALGR
jgi:DNA phosphorothioation-dependent restriction protein DptH